MRTLTVSFVVAIFVSVLMLMSSHAHAATSSGVTYQGRIIKPDGEALEASNVQFRIQVRTPGNENCLMFEEVQSLDMTSSKGLFGVTIGQGTRTDTTGYTLDQIFGNRGTFTLPGAICTVGSNYTPNADDGRDLVVYFRETPSSTWEPMPTTQINYVPFAFESKQIAGFTAPSLLRVADGATLGNVSPLSTANYNSLMALIAGTSSQYQQYGKLQGVNLPASFSNGQVLGWSGGAWSAVDPLAGLPTFARTALPTCAAGEFLRENGSGALVCTTPASSGGTVTAITAGAGLTGGTITTTGTIALPVLGAGGTAVKVTYDTFGRITSAGSLAEADIPTLVTAGKVSGDAINTGTIGGNAAVNTTGNLTTTGAITGALVSGNTLTTKSIEVFETSNNYKVSIIAPGTLGADYTITLPGHGGAPGQVLTTDGAGSLTWSNTAVTGITSLTGDVTASGTGAVSATLANTGVTSGTYGSSSTVPTFTVDSKGRLTAAGSVTISGTAPGGAAGADLAGTYPNPTVARIQGMAINAGTLGPADAGKAFVWQGTEYASQWFGIHSLKSATGVNQFASATCTSSQTLTWSALTDTFTCVDIAGLNASVITTGTLSASVLPIVPVAKGGTNSPTALFNNRIMITSGGAVIEAPALLDGQLLIGQTGGAPIPGTLTAGPGISIVNGAGSITISASTVSAGDITTAKIADDAVTFAKLQNINSNRIIGRSTAGSGDAEEIQIGGGMSLSQGTLGLVVGGGLAITNGTLAATGGGGDFYRDGSVSMTGAFRAVSGTAAAPGLAYSADAATGMYLLAPGTLAFSTAGSHRMALDSNGYLGVGTLTPTQALDVVGNVNLSGAFYLRGMQFAHVPTFDAYSMGIGYLALSNAGGTSYENVALGAQGLNSLTTGNRNTAVGALAGYSITTGSRNTIVGRQALLYGNGSSNVAVGDRAIGGVAGGSSGSWNTAVGENAMRVSQNANNNVSMGYHSLYNLDTGNSNIAIGSQAGDNLYSGSSNILIGGDVSAATMSNSINIGNTIYGNRSSGGSVGIGTTTNLSGNKFEVRNGAIAAGSASSTLGGTVRFYDLGASGNNFVAFRAPGEIVNDVAWTLPASDAAGSGYALVSDGAGSLAWQSLGGGGDFFRSGSSSMTGNFLAAHGSSLTPGIAFSHDTDTGMYNAGANSLAIVTNGQERIRFNGAGQVGIGTTTPGTTLDVVGITRATQFSVAGGAQINAINGSDTVFRLNEDFYFQNPAGTTDYFTILNSGNVGIGTSTPSMKFEVSGTDATGSGIASNFRNLSTGTLAWSGHQLGNDIGPTSYFWTGSSTYRYPHFRSRTVLESDYTNGAGVSIVASSASADIQFYTGGLLANNERMRIDSIGNVGIGSTTTYPGVRLQVNGGAIAAGSTSPTYGGEVRFYDLGSSGNNYVGFRAPASLAYDVTWTLPAAEAGGAGYALVSNGAGSLAWQSLGGGGDFFRSGSASMTGQFLAAHGSSLTPGIAFSHDTNTGIYSAGSDTLALATAGTTAVTIGSTGNVGIGTTPSAVAKLDVNGEMIVNGLTLGRGAGTLTSNVAFGFGSMNANVNGSYNSAVGNASLYYNTTGSYNTAYGSSSLFNNRTGAMNTAVGYNAIANGTNTSSNVAVGIDAARFTQGNANTVVGAYAMGTSTSGTGNVLLGASAGYDIASGNYNVIIGSNYGTSIANSSNNIILADGQGNARLQVNSSGQVGIGTATPYSGSRLHIGGGALAVGSIGSGTGNGGQIRLYDLGSSGNNYVAFRAPDSLAADVTWSLPSTDGGVGYALVSNGSGSLSWASLSSGSGRIVAKAATNQNITLSGLQTIDDKALAAGDYVLVKNQTFSYENGLYIASAGAWTRAPEIDTWAELLTAEVYVSEGTVARTMHYVAVPFNSSGTLGVTTFDWAARGSNYVMSNTSFGVKTMDEQTSGYDNSAFGAYAMQETTTGDSNVAFGAYSLGSNTIGSQNVAVGVSALGNLTWGHGNVGVGHSALEAVTTGGYNIGIGRYAGRFIGAGSNNVVIGGNDGLSIANTSNNILLADGAGNLRMRIDSSGNVGIGTDAPLTKLDVRGGAISAGSVSSTVGGEVRFYDLGASGNNYVAFRAPASIALDSTWTLPAADGTAGQVLSTNGAGSLSWTTASGGSSIWSQVAGGTIHYSGGNVGIGTNNPTSLLTVDTGGAEKYIALKDGATTYALLGNADASSGYLGLYSAGTLRATLDSRTNASSFTQGSMNIGATNGDQNSRLDIRTPVGVGFLTMSTGTLVGNVVMVDTAGNVGIGTANPGVKLEVAGDILIPNTKKLLWEHGDGTTYISGDGTLTTGSMRFGTANADRLTIEYDGNVGIGTTDPAFKMHVVENTSPQLIYETANNTWSNAPGFLGRRARTSAGTLAVVEAYDTLAAFGARGYHGGGWAAGSSGSILFRAQENFNSGRGTAIDFETTPNGSSARVGRMTLTGEGNLGIGTQWASNRLEVYGTIAAGSIGVGTGNGGQFRFYDIGLGGSNYVAFRSPDNVPTNVLWTLPASDGAAGQYLQTNGTGSLSWAAATGGGDFFRDGSATMTGQLVLAAGTSSAPALTFADDLDTGLFQYTNNTMSFASNGQERIRFSNNGIISQSTGSFLLSGGVSASFPSYSFENDTDTGMYRSGPNALAFAVAGTNALTISSTNTVAVPGTLTMGNGAYATGWSAGGPAFWLDLPTTGPSAIGYGGPGANTMIGYVHTGSNYFAGSANGDIVYRGANTKRLLFGIDNGFGNSNPTMAVHANGVSIGTSTLTSTNVKLDVAGQIVSRNVAVASGATADFSLGNTQTLSSIGGSTITLSNMADGGAYTLIIEDTTVRTYSFAGCTNVYANGFGPSSGRSIVNIIKNPSGCYIAVASGFKTCTAANQVFTHTGSDQSYVVPQGCTTATVKAWGAGGGGGGIDAATYGGAGGGGGYASSTITTTPGETLTFRVGGGGGAGLSAAAATGGGAAAFGGGAAGGDAGGSGTSGAGGAGGGGSFVLRSSTIIVAAGGGGGGGGAGNGSTGGAGGGGGQNGGAGGATGGTAGASGTTSGLVGGSMPVGSDGAGAGGGGGGYAGGGGGTAPAGDLGGGGGGGGSSFGDTTSNGNNTSPGNSGDVDRGTSGTGGPAATSGSSGKIVLIWN